MPTNEFRETNGLPTQGKSLERSAVEQQVRAMQADSAAHTDMLRRTADGGGGGATLPAGVIATRAKNLFGQLRARAIGVAASPILAEPGYHADDASLNQVGLVPRHMRRASDMRRSSETETVLAPPPAPEIPVALSNEAQPRGLWLLYEIVPSIDFETPDLRRRIKGAQPGAQHQPVGLLPVLLMLPLLAVICLCLSDVSLGW